jgi:hypothetical protein
MCPNAMRAHNAHPVGETHGAIGPQPDRPSDILVMPGQSIPKLTDRCRAKAKAVVSVKNRQVGRLPAPGVGPGETDR